jgi:hypothetical protein
MASDHQAEYHVQGSTTPSKHCQSALQLAQHGLRYTHAENINIVTRYATEDAVMTGNSFSLQS